MDDVPVVDPGLLEALRGDLAPYTVEAVEERLGALGTAALGREQRLPALRALRPLIGADGVAALAAAFVLGEPLPRRVLDAALPRLGTAGAARLGLVVPGGADGDDPVHPLVDLRPYSAGDAGHWWVASDPGELATRGPLREDHVLGIGGASAMLAQCTTRRPVGRVLDLGTGCGVQALHARRHAAHVTGTDVSRRALAFAAFNLALDVAATPYHLIEGSLLEPVAGQRFDLVVSNPPFVITPRRDGVPAYEYRDGGQVGDALVESLVTGLGAVLAPGGTAQLLGNWEHRRGLPWDERVRGWLAASGLDGWVVQREVQDVAEYAQLWIRDGGAPDPDRFDALLGAWLDDFASRDVEAVGFGIITLRKPLRDSGSDGAPPPGRPLIARVEEARGPVTGPLGEHLAAGLDALELLASQSPSQLLARTWLVADDVTEERYHRPGEEDPAVILLRQGGGFGRAVQVTGTVAAVVGACDGDLPLDRIVGAVAHLLEEPADDVARQVLRFLDADLVAGGFLRLARA